IPEGATILQNPNGSAPGIFLETQGKQVFLLPGPPHELEAMWDAVGLPLLKKEKPFQRQIFKIAMMAESKVDEVLQPVSQSLIDVSYTILANIYEIEIHLFAPEDAATELVSASAQVRAILGNRIYTEQLETLEEVVGRFLKKSGKTLATAESCTGGMLGHRITQVPGSSAYYNRGAIVYSNQAKTEMLKIPSSLIEQNGAVSEPVAKAMAEQIRNIAGTDFGIGITGIAGPDGGTPEKPVGTVYIALSDSTGTSVQKFQFPGKRDRIKFASTQAALDMLRLKLL
ncbi:MAG: competence/damage-inducible protein A, partial [Acidobacteria bacterium]